MLGILIYKRKVVMWILVKAHRFPFQINLFVLPTPPLLLYVDKQLQWKVLQELKNDYRKDFLKSFSFILYLENLFGKILLLRPSCIFLFRVSDPFTVGIHALKQDLAILMKSTFWILFRSTKKSSKVRLSKV